MPRFFIRQSQIEKINGERAVRITGDDAHHISRSLRMAVGEEIEVCDMQKNVYRCRLSAFYEKEVIATVIGEGKIDTEPKYEITLYQALSKGEKMETIIQKCTECGVSRIVPVSTERCVVKIDKRDEGKKLERWQRIAEGGAKQSGRGIIPEISPILSLKQAIEEAKKASLVIFCYEAEDGYTIKDALRNAKIDTTIAVIVGSEGGFSINEAEYIKSQGIKAVGLGKRILRCETAGMFALSCIVYETEM